jgi:hypothetical protein
MNDNIVDLQGEVAKRRTLDSVESQGERVHDNHEYTIELEHEILELQQQVCALHRDLERERARRKTE